VQAPSDLVLSAMQLASLPKNFRRIRDVARMPYDGLSLGALLRGTRPDPPSMLRSSQWMQEQLPVRLARRIEDFIQLPHVVVSNPQVNTVLHHYLDTFDAVSSFPPVTEQEHVERFRELISHHMQLHNHGTRQIADGYRQVRRLYPHIRLDSFLHTFFTSRIAMRILMENFVNQHQPQEGFIGVVKTNMRPLSITMDCADELKKLVKQIYGVTPDVEFRGNLDCTLDYIPRHVSYMIQEVLKNALRATVEWHLQACPGPSSIDVPPVMVELQKGDVHVIIKISDQGGGMPRKMQEEAWQYGWTTVAQNSSSEEAQEAHGAKMQLNQGLAGFGFGLPLTRLHAQYFGGDVFMQALPGHGTDMYLLLTHLKEGSKSTEVEDLATTLEQGLFRPVASIDLSPS